MNQDPDPLQQQPFPPQQQWPQAPMAPMQPVQPPPKKRRVGRNVGIGCGILFALVIVIVIIAGASSNGSLSSQADQQATASNNAAVAAGETAISNDQLTQAASIPSPQPTSQPTSAPTPVPTVSAALLEATYKASTTDTTIATLDKDGNADAGTDVHFTATILNFVKDSNGNTAGANMSDPTTAGVVQIAFPTGTDLSQLNADDTLEVWGTDGGTASGQNAFGGTVQEVVISANYLTDRTTGYQSQ